MFEEVAYGLSGAEDPLPSGLPPPPLPPLGTPVTDVPDPRGPYTGVPFIEEPPPLGPFDVATEPVVALLGL